jgi:hypothetical protein
MLALFRSRLPAAQTHQLDMRQLRLARRFEGVVAWDSCFHLTHDAQRQMFPVFYAHSASGTRLLFTSGPQHGEAIGALEGEALYHASLSANEYTALLTGCGFGILTHVAEDPNCRGRTVWLAERTALELVSEAITP